MSRTLVKDVVSRHHYEEHELLAVLQDIQHRQGYLPEEDLVEVSEQLRVPLSRIYGIATFYRTFSLVPRGRHLVQVCTGSACLLRGARRLLERLSAELGIEPGATTEDGAFTLSTVRCAGVCNLAPAVLLDGKPLCGGDFDELRRLMQQAGRSDEP